jgi:hypothetical protein
MNEFDVGLTLRKMQHPTYAAQTIKKLCDFCTLARARLVSAAHAAARASRGQLFFILEVGDQDFGR